MRGAHFGGTGEKILISTPVPHLSLNPFTRWGGQVCWASETVRIPVSSASHFPHWTYIYTAFTWIEPGRVRKWALIGSGEGKPEVKVKDKKWRRLWLEPLPPASLASFTLRNKHPLHIDGNSSRGAVPNPNPGQWRPPFPARVAIHLSRIRSSRRSFGDVWNVFGLWWKHRRTLGKNLILYQNNNQLNQKEPSFI